MADRVPLPFGSDSGDLSFEDYKVRPPLQVTSGDAMQASFDQAQQGTAVGMLARASAIGNDTLGAILKDTVWGKDPANLTGSGVRDISPEEANARYPDMQTKWNKPVNPYVAQLLSDREQENRKLEATIAAGPQDMWSKAKNMGAGFLAHAMDPLEFGATAVIGWGVGAAVTKTAWGARTALLTKLGVSTVGQRTAFHAAEAIGGNLIQSAGLEAADIATSKMEGQPVDPYKAMQNIAINTFFGSVLHLGIKEFSYQSANRLSRFVNKNSPEADLAISRTAVAQAEQGISPNIEPIMKAVAQETDVKGDYVYQPIMQGEPIGERKFYVASNPVSHFSPSEARHFGDVTGDSSSIKLTDNANVANAASVRAMADSPGKVFEVSASEVNPIHLDQPIPMEAVPAFRDAVSGLMSDAEFEKATPKEVLSRLWDAIDNSDVPESKITELQNKLKEAGFNAFLGDGSKVMGFEHSQHNDLTVFDPEALKPTENQWNGNQELRNAPTQEDLSAATNYGQDVRNRMEVDPKALDNFDRNMKEFNTGSQGRTDDFAYVDEQAKSYMEDLQQLEKQGILDPQGKQDLEILSQIDKNSEIDRTLFKALETCLRN